MGGTILQQADAEGCAMYVISPDYADAVATHSWQAARSFHDKGGWSWVNEDDGPTFDLADWHDLAEAVEDHARGTRNLTPQLEDMAMTYGLAIPPFGSVPDYRLNPASRPVR